MGGQPFLKKKKKVRLCCTLAMAPPANFWRAKTSSSFQPKLEQERTCTAEQLALLPGEKSSRRKPRRAHRLPGAEVPVCRLGLEQGVHVRCHHTAPGLRLVWGNFREFL